MKSAIRIVVPLVAALLALTFGAARALAQAPDVGEGVCISNCADSSSESSSGESSSDGGETSLDPAIAEQRAAEQAAREAARAAERAEALATWERAANNLRSLGSRGRSLEEDSQAFSVIFDGAGEQPGLVIVQIGRVSGTGAGPTPRGPRDQSAGPPNGSQAPPPPARGLRINEVPPPFRPDRFLRPSSEAWSAQAPEVVGGLLTSLPDPQEIVEKATGWLTDTALDEIEQRVPGVRQLRSIYGTAEQYAQIGQDLSRENGVTIEGVFRAAGEVIRCMAGSPCDEAFVHSLPEARGEAYRSTALGWIHELVGGDDDDDTDGDDQ